MEADCGRGAVGVSIAPFEIHDERMRVSGRSFLRVGRAISIFVLLLVYAALAVAWFFFTTSDLHRLEAVLTVMQVFAVLSVLVAVAFKYAEGEDWLPESSRLARIVGHPSALVTTWAIISCLAIVMATVAVLPGVQGGLPGNGPGFGCEFYVANKGRTWCVSEAEYSAARLGEVFAFTLMLGVLPCIASVFLAGSGSAPRGSPGEIDKS